MDYKSKEHLDSYQEFLEWYWKDDQELEENAPNNSDDAHLYWMYSSWLAGRKAKGSLITEQEPVAWRKLCKDGFYHLFHQKVGWKDCSGFEPLYASAPNIEALTKERDEDKELTQSLMANVLELKTERDALMAARYAYASEFALDIDGEPDVGSIHQNIRALMQAAKLALDAMDHGYMGCNHASYCAAIDTLKKAIKD